MPKFVDVCRYIRSKNAGPFWITVDFFFKDEEAFARHAEADGFQASRLAAVFGVSTDRVKRHALPDLGVVKISYPRAVPQGGILERDMHGGQQYVRLLELDI